MLDQIIPADSVLRCQRALIWNAIHVHVLSKQPIHDLHMFASPCSLANSSDVCIFLRAHPLVVLLSAEELLGDRAELAVAIVDHLHLLQGFSARHYRVSFPRNLLPPSSRIEQGRRS